MRRIEAEFIVRVSRVRLVGEARVAAPPVTMRRRIMVVPALAIGMTLGNSGIDDTEPWDGFRIDRLHHDVSCGLVSATMEVRAESQRAEHEQVRYWKAAGWRCL